MNKKYKYYQIKVSIKGTQPLVWRRLLIPEGITFHELNAIIQIAFG
ncbi:MAG: plasmid pRiA4b ORF-3 family protein [Clostridia bacterium]|nr:plasmid pRiA4b ORF-3 family protein [Clostridia bacterium]